MKTTSDDREAETMDRFFTPRVRPADGVHTFAGCSTHQVYDLSQCDDSIRFGDVLVVPDERVVGIMIGAWPTAVTKTCGDFHCKARKFTWASFNRTGEPDYAAAATAAVGIARSLGYEVDETKGGA